jgi:hypothetical protein
MAAPAQVTTPNPANHAYGTVSPALLALTWAAAAGATSYNVYFRRNGTDFAVSLGQTGLSYALPGLLHGYGYTWRVDSVNADGVTTGVAWDFSTLIIDAPEPTAENAMALRMRVVAVANDKVYYEDVI